MKTSPLRTALFAAFLAAALASALRRAVPGAAAQGVPMGEVMCECPGASKPLGDAPSCEVACGGRSGPVIRDDGAAKRLGAQAEAEERARLEAAADAESRRQDGERRQREFNARKSEALRDLKGGPAETGLKDDPGAGPALKELTPARQWLKGAEEPLSGGRECRIVDACADALESQTKALDAANRDRRDLYYAVITSDLPDEASAAAQLSGHSGSRMTPFFYVWKNKDAAGLPIFTHEYKTTVDGIAGLLDRKRAGAVNGVDDMKGGLLKSSAIPRPSMAPREAAAMLHKLHQNATALLGFARYMAALKRCTLEPDEKFNDCVTAAGKKFSKTAGELETDVATIGRVKAAALAYTRYSIGALERSRDLSEAASKCFKGCR